MKETQAKQTKETQAREERKKEKKEKPEKIEKACIMKNKTMKLYNIGREYLIPSLEVFRLITIWSGLLGYVDDALWLRVLSTLYKHKQTTQSWVNIIVYDYFRHQAMQKFAF